MGSNCINSKSRVSIPVKFLRFATLLAKTSTERQLIFTTNFRRIRKSDCFNKKKLIIN